jgi:hypothetical protein
MATIYRKTAKGHSEIETRAFRLPPRLRSALILIDGKRSDDDMRKLIVQQPEETLRTLSEQGFIEVIAITQDPPAARQPGTTAPARQPIPGPAAAAAPAAATQAATPAAAASAAVAPKLARNFEATRAEAVRAFTELVGPIAEALAIKMERTRNVDELRPLVLTARSIIANARGAAAAADYGARFLGSAGS